MVKKAVKKASKEQKSRPKKKSLSTIIYRSIAETLQANSQGEFDLPSILVQYNDKSHPKFRLGLHREMYIPAAHVPFYEPLTEKAMGLFQNQASIVIYGLLGEGIPVREKEFKLPLCKDCR